MRVYFLADRSCALRVNGLHLGLVDSFERMTELNPQDGIICELIPMGGFLPVCFRFDEDFLFAPPKGFDLYYTQTGVAVYAHGFLRADQGLRVVWQKRMQNTLCTLTVQGKLLLNIDSPQGFELMELDDRLEQSELSVCGENLLLEGNGAFLLFSRKGEKILFSEGEILEREPLLKAEVPFHDSMGHSAICEWEGGTLKSCKIRTRREPTEATFALALFESALIGADCTPFLASALQEKAGSLKSYLGDYSSVILTGAPDRVGLVYKRNERVFDVRYFTVELQDGKISNLKPV